MQMFRTPISVVTPESVQSLSLLGSSLEHNPVLTCSNLGAGEYHNVSLLN